MGKKVQHYPLIHIFFEFKEYNKNNVRLAHELEQDKKYEVVLTTSGGLYRYNLEDIVKVTGFKNQCPLLKFMGRGSNLSDLFGEKLNELHVASVLQETFKKYELQPHFFMVSPEKIGKFDSPSYALFIESDKPSNRLLAVAETLDEKLQENYHYKYCRKLGQLGPMKIFRVTNSNNSKRASDIYLEERQEKGKKIGNVKPAVLNSQIGWSKIFNGSFIKK